ncbi:MAG: hypothetical protein QM613_05410, partial [Micrococcaceae bacterium]
MSSKDLESSEARSGFGSGVSRRSVAKGALWSVPVVATAVSVPAFAASACDPSTYTINFLPVGSVPAPGYAFPYGYAEGSSKVEDGTLSVQVTAADGCTVSGNVVLTVTSNNANFTTKDTGPNTVTIALNGAGIATFGTEDSGNPLFLASSLKPGDSVIVHAQIEGTSVETGSGGNGDDMVINIGNLYGWGANFSGSNGTGYRRYAPVQVGANEPKTDWASIKAGHNFSLALSSSGDLYATGYNGSGALGLGDTSDRSVFTKVDAPSGGGTWTSISTRVQASFSLGLSSSGDLYATGQNDNGELGLSDTTDRNVFTKVDAPSGGGTWTSISAGRFHSLALSSSSGDLYATGQNDNGELGLSDTTDRNVFTKVDAPSGGGTWTSISAGSYFSLALSSSGDLYASGYNVSGALGLSDTTDRNVFTKVDAPSGGGTWTSIS